MGVTLVGIAVLIGVGSFALGMVPLMNRGTIPPQAIVEVSALAVAAALLGGWLYGRLASRSWWLGLLVLPLVLVIGLALLVGSSVPMRQACRTYHTDAVCAPWMR